MGERNEQYGGIYKVSKANETFKSFNKQNMILTRQICEEAIALDPNYEPAHSVIWVRLYNRHLVRVGGIRPFFH